MPDLDLELELGELRESGQSSRDPELLLLLDLFPLLLIALLLDDPLLRLLLGQSSRDVGEDGEARGVGEDGGGGGGGGSTRGTVGRGVGGGGSTRGAVGRGAGGGGGLLGGRLRLNGDGGGLILREDLDLCSGSGGLAVSADHVGGGVNPDSRA